MYYILTSYLGHNFVDVLHFYMGFGGVFPLQPQSSTELAVRGFIIGQQSGPIISYFLPA